MKVKFLQLFAACSLLGFNANAQFSPSTIPESVAGTSSNVSKTANDSRAKINVVAWDGTTPGIYYNVSGTAISGTISLPAGSVYPDVVLSANLHDQNVWMLIVYQNAGSLRLARYQWNGSTFVYNSAISLINVSSQIKPTMSIDADIAGNYAIALGRSDGSIAVYHGANNTLPGGLVQNSATAAATGKNVDVCTNYGTGTTNIHVSYINTAGTEVKTIGIPFAGTTFGTATTVAAISTGTTYSNARIASPKNNNEANDRYAIVYTKRTITDMLDYAYIVQYHMYNGVSRTNVISGGGVNHPNPNLQHSERPAVTYCEGLAYRPATIAAFRTLDPNHNLIGMNPDAANWNAVLWPTPLFVNARYYTINQSAPSDCDYLALSSKYADYSDEANDVLMSYYSTGNHNIYYKQITSSVTTTMKTMHPAGNNIGTKNITVYPNPAADHIFITTENFVADDPVQVSITDITGRSSYCYTGEIQNLRAAADAWFAGIVPGVYYAKISGNDGYVQLLKLVKQ